MADPRTLWACGYDGTGARSTLLGVLASRLPATLDAFCDDGHLERRDDLALRRLGARAGALTAAETAELAALDWTLNRLLPRPTPAPACVLEAIEGVRRLLGGTA